MRKSNKEYNTDTEFLKALPKKVIKHFVSKKNNTTTEIAKLYNVPVSRVNKIISQYLANSMKK